MQTWEELRDLVTTIDRVARDHPGYTIAHEIVRGCVNHIRAEARVHEVNALLREKLK